MKGTTRISESKMSNRARLIVLVSALLSLAPGRAIAEAGGTCRTIRLNLDYLALTKQKWLAGDETLSLAMNYLISNADIWMERGPYSVMDKDEIPPSGDKHDFLSYGYYWWPNPDTNDGLPWIRRDGYGNPDNNIDYDSLNPMSQAVEALTLAYYFTDHEPYAERAAYLLRTFFLDEATLMNPSCYYANVIPGVSPGGFAVVGFANRLRYVFDGAGILERSPAWTEADKQGLQQWCRDLLEFMETTPQGEAQRDEPSNHGTNYDFLATMLALYADDPNTAREKILSYAQDRMPGQISADGSNPLEMERADNLLYHCYNLRVAFEIAQVGDHLDDVDLWNYETEDGRGLRMALEFLIPYFLEEQEWPYWSGEPFKLTPYRYYRLLRRAALGYDSFRFEGFAQALNYSGSGIDYFNLIYPWFAITPAQGDFEPDGDVDLYDFAVLGSAWRSISGDGNWNPACDIFDPNDNIIDTRDLAVFANNWLY